MYKVFGICTDTIIKEGKIVLKNGKRLFGAVGWYRIINPLKKLGYETSIGWGIKATAEDALALKEKGDIWVCKMADNEGIDHLYGSHRDFTGAKFVLDLDDDPEHVNLDHPDYDELADRQDMRIRMLGIADHIIAATENIKATVKKHNPNVTVIPNAIDPKIWKVKSTVKKDLKTIRIGWMSSGSHFSDLPLIQKVQDDILEKYPNVEFHFAGMVWGDEEGDRVYHHNGTTGYKEFPQFYANLNIDIAIAPLKDNQFNNCKSNIKWLEAAMLSIPTVASDVTPYKDIDHGKTGYLASTPGQMTKYLSWLIEDKDKRVEMGKAAKEEALKNWNIEKFLPEYTKLFDKLMEKKDITVMTSITGGKDKLKEQPEYPGVKYIAFTDEEVDSDTWEIRKATDKFSKPVMNAKLYKCLGHKYTDTDYIMWIDGSITLKEDPHVLMKEMKEKDMAFFKHPGRDCVYDEAEACVGLNLGDVSEIAEQVKTYAGEMFPEKAGLSELTVFMRKNNKKTNTLFERWWAEICRFSNRDQLSFPFVFKGQKWYTIKGSVNVLKDNYRFPGNKYFKFKKHKK